MTPDPLRQINKDLTAENARLTKELDEIANRARLETERHLWRAAYEELLDKLVGRIS